MVQIGYLDQAIQCLSDRSVTSVSATIPKQNVIFVKKNTKDSK